MNKIWYSKQWDNAPMPHAVFFTKEGHAIHGTNETKRLGKPASHGCVRLSPQNATLLFDLVKKTGMKNTQVVLSGETPGGDGQKISQPRQRKRKPQYGKNDSGRFEQGYAQPQRRCGLFRRRWCGGPYYNGR